MEKKEGKEDGWNKRERDTTRREMEWWRERKEKEKQRREKMERGFTFSRPLGAIGPVCYGLFIPLAPITTQWAALFSSTQYNNSWAILAWHTTGGTPKVGKRKEHDLKWNLLESNMNTVRMWAGFIPRAHMFDICMHPWHSGSRRMSATCYARVEGTKVI